VIVDNDNDFDKHNEKSKAAHGGGAGQDEEGVTLQDFVNEASID